MILIICVWRFIMNKNKKIVMVLILAILLALVTGYAVVSFLSPHRTTIYVFNMKDKTSFSIEIECDWIIKNKKRYLIE